MKEQFTAGIQIEMDARNPRQFIKLSLNFEAVIFLTFAVVTLAIGLAHSCQRVPPAPGRVMSYGQDAPTAFVVPAGEVQEMSVLPTITAPKAVAPAAKKVDFERNANTQRDGRYIKRFQGVAITEMKKFGIPASISMAQGLLESTSGTSEMAEKINNHFGIKCHSRNCRKGHCSNFHDDSHKDFFRRFNNAWESWRAHSLLLHSGDRYKGLKKHGTDYKAWAHGLKKAGYATDKKYAEKLINMIEKYDLSRLDSGQLFQ